MPKRRSRSTDAKEQSKINMRLNDLPLQHTQLPPITSVRSLLVREAEEAKSLCFSCTVGEAEAPSAHAPKSRCENPILCSHFFTAISLQLLFRIQLLGISVCEPNQSERNKNISKIYIYYSIYSLYFLL
uniref:Uncharacterized protein n=1 Tax=Pediastrum angulosum TaxID=271408 RepID=A0A2U8GHX2_9CHLO|nr:hypothetical protein [Pediastrum angulosum]